MCETGQDRQNFDRIIPSVDFKESVLPHQTTDFSRESGEGECDGHQVEGMRTADRPRGYTTKQGPRD